jgi:ADP-ribose pyrophosphatase YjhB (NUDIX family)
MNYRIPRARVKAILNNSKNEILFSMANKEDSTSIAKIPVGEIYYNESAEVSVKRIITESTPYEVEPIAILGIYSEHALEGTDHFLTAVFICIVTEFCPVTPHLKLGFKWLNSKKISDADIHDDDIRILRDYRDWRIHKSTYWTSKIV